MAEPPRLMAADVRCPHCGAGPKMPCHINGQPLKFSSAHPSRHEAVGRQYETGAVAKYRELYPAERVSPWMKPGSGVAVPDTPQTPAPGDAGTPEEGLLTVEVADDA